jgi:predicted nucleic acid-binding protein
MTTLIDTDTLFGLVVDTDHLHARTLALSKRLHKQSEAIVHLLPTTLGEFSTLATIRLGFNRSKYLTDTIAHLGLRLMDVTKEMMVEANALYQKQTSKENSLFDCYVMIAAKHQNIDCIFSFDKGYKQNGFVLIEDFLQAPSAL